MSDLTQRGELLCRCGKVATCVGRYEAMTAEEPACDDCCGHGCEDGWCTHLDELTDEEFGEVQKVPLDSVTA